ncbi:MAG: 5'-3' exonuclease H3TH domain-containing protein, partial [bacterium]
MIDPDLKMSRLFLLDGTAIAYRSYFAFIRNPLINSKGVNTSGVFGFTNTLLKILKEEKPDYIACAFDMAAPTFRHKAFPAYKATREKMPDELADQLPIIKKIVEAFRIPLVEAEGYEADDVMGTLAMQAEAEHIETYLVTGDKDFMQLVSDRVKMYSLGRGGDSELVGPEGVVERMGVPPDRVVDLLGLMGDSSDNVPGVPGIGPKTALGLLETWGRMEDVLDQADRVEKQSIREKLKAYKEQAILSKDLVTIRTDVPLDLSVSDLRVEAMDRNAVVSLFKELEFSRFLRDLPEFLEKPEDGFERKYSTIGTIQDLERLVKMLSKVQMFALDLETTSLDPISADIVGFSFAWSLGEAVYIPVLLPEGVPGGDLFAAEDGTSCRIVLDKLGPILEDPRIRKCGQNIKYDMLVLRRHGVDVDGVDFDSMVAAYLINPSARQHGIWPPKRWGVKPIWTGVLMDTNSCEDDHWWYKAAEEDKPDGWKFFDQPSALIKFQTDNQVSAY